jgi:hypothetical protein
VINKLLSVVLSVIFLLIGLSYAPFSALAVPDSANPKLLQVVQETLLDDVQDDRLVAHERTLAELSYKSGVRVVFSYDEIWGEYGLLQEGLNGENDPLVDGEVTSLLATFLAITPDNVPVPTLLLAEAPADMDLSAQINIREVSPSLVKASQLELPITATVRRNHLSCNGSYFPGSDWHEDVVQDLPGDASALPPKQYYSSDFDGRVRYANSYIFNCTPAGSPSWLWARHRLYYKFAGTYIKQFEGKVAPGLGQAVTRGKAKWYRKVSYDDGWDSSPNCGYLTGINCKYSREGRFNN